MLSLIIIIIIIIIMIIIIILSQQASGMCDASQSPHESGQLSHRIVKLA